MKNMYQNLSTSLIKIMKCNGLVRGVWSQNVKRHESKKKCDMRMGDGIKTSWKWNKEFWDGPRIIFFQLLNQLLSRSNKRLLRRLNRQCRYDGH